MKQVKKTENYIIFERNDGRYAIRDRNRNPVNGEEKLAILSAEGLVKVKVPQPSPGPSKTEDTPADEDNAPEEKEEPKKSE